MKRGASKTPRRGRKGDSIISPSASREQIMVDMAVVAFDRTALEMDRKWGIDRLVDLVAPDMAIKYGQALARMNEAISDGGDPTLAQRRANDCVRGMQAMDRVATESGAQRASEPGQLMIRYPSDQDNAPSAADLAYPRGILIPQNRIKVLL